MFGGDLPHRILIKVLEEIVGPSEMVSDQEVVTKTSHFCLTFVFLGVFRSSSILCVNFQCCDVRCELGVTNDLGEQANLRRGCALFACVSLATADIVQLAWLGLLSCVFTTERCVLVNLVWGRWPAPPSVRLCL